MGLSKKKTIGIVITDGVGFRNFVLSNFLNEISSVYDEVFIYSGLPLSLFKDNKSDNIVLRELKEYKEGRLTWFFRKFKEVAHLQLHKKKAYGIQDSLKMVKAVRGFSIRAILNTIIYYGALVLHSNNFIYLLEKLQFKSFQNNAVAKSYYLLLEKDQPDLIFFTHQRPPFLAPILDSTKRLKIKTASFIFSWDNLASKGRMLGTFDFYFVWSILMKSELLEFYPDTSEESVFVVGTPQFESYVMSKYDMSEANFRDKFGLNSNTKIICYSCADASIGANDIIHIKAVYEYLKNKKEFQLLVRTSPADGGERFNELKENYPEIIWNVPKWYQVSDGHAEAWSQRLPSVEDVIDLKAILKYSFMNINMLSTMSLDFMLFDKPVINTVFGNTSNGLYNDQRFLNYRHYSYVIDSGAVNIAKEKSSLFKHLDETIANPNLKAEQRKAIIDLEISCELKGTSQRITKYLSKL